MLPDTGERCSTLLFEGVNDGTPTTKWLEFGVSCAPPVFGTSPRLREL